MKPTGPTACDQTDLPSVLSSWRRQGGLSIENTAHELGVSPATWGHWENGRRFPNARNLDLLSHYTDLSIRELLCARYAECPFRDHSAA